MKVIYSGILKKIILFAAISISLVQPAAMAQESTTNYEDSVFQIEDLGSILSAVSENLKVRYPNPYDTIEKRFLYDLTGDGIDETLIYRYLHKDSAYEVSRVIKEGKSSDEILNESMDLSFIYMYYAVFEEDSAFYQYLPYSALDFALFFDTANAFMKELPMDSESGDYDVVVLAHLDNYDEQFKRYVKHYHGSYVSSLSPESPDLLIWYEPKREFRVIYSP